MPAGFVVTALLRQMLVCCQRRDDWLTAQTFGSFLSGGFQA